MPDKCSVSFNFFATETNFNLGITLRTLNQLLAALLTKRFGKTGGLCNTISETRQSGWQSNIVN